MNFQTAPKPDKPAPVSIVVNGRVVGDLSPHGTGWHAHITVPVTTGYGSSGGFSGFGPSHEAAIADAILRGIRVCHEESRKLVELAGEIGLEKPEEQP